MQEILLEPQKKKTKQKKNIMPYSAKNTIRALRKTPRTVKNTPWTTRNTPSSVQNITSLLFTLLGIPQPGNSFTTEVRHDNPMIDVSKTSFITFWEFYVILLFSFQPKRSLY